MACGCGAIMHLRLSQKAIWMSSEKSSWTFQKRGGHSCVSLSFSPTYFTACCPLIATDPESRHGRCVSTRERANSLGPGCRDGRMAAPRVQAD